MELFRQIFITITLITVIPELSHAESIQSLVDFGINIWEFVNPQLKENPDPVFFNNAKDKILNKVDVVQHKVDLIDGKMKIQTDIVVDALRRNLPQIVRNELRISNLQQILAEIDRMDKLLKDYRSKGNNSVSTHSLLKLTSSIISHDYNSMLSMWDRLHSTYLVPESDRHNALPTKSILHQMAEIIEKEYENNFCKFQQSPMQLLYNLYNSLQLSQLKAYTLMQFSWLYSKTTNESSNYDQESYNIKNLYIKRLPIQAEVARNAMKKTSQAMWRCDPEVHVDDKTYTSLTHFLQGFIVNEVNINTEYSCGQNCIFYSYTKQYGCYQDSYCTNQPVCRGNVINCNFVDSNMWICPSDYDKSKRRYDWIKFENGRVLGENYGSCKKSVDTVYSWWRYIFWHCSQCFCICDEIENRKSDRYFSLGSVVSDVKNNRVITGLKMIKKNQVIYIQGYEGELKPYGEINETTLKWIPIKEVNPHSYLTREGWDYHTMSWRQRAVDLDNLVAPPDHILTGVKWRKVGSHLNFLIQVCRWNFTTGTLLQNGQKCQWITNDNTEASRYKPRTKIYLNSPDKPTKFRVPSRMDSKNNQFVEFTHSDIDSDVAQSAVPYIDIQPVVPSPAVPLIGAGIYHKGMYKSGGFIAPKIFTLDYTKYMPTNFDKN